MTRFSKQQKAAHEFGAMCAATQARGSVFVVDHRLAGHDIAARVGYWSNSKTGTAQAMLIMAGMIGDDERIIIPISRKFRGIGINQPALHSEIAVSVAATLTIEVITLLAKVTAQAVVAPFTFHTFVQTFPDDDGILREVQSWLKASLKIFDLTDGFWSPVFGKKQELRYVLRVIGGSHNQRYWVCETLDPKKFLRDLGGYEVRAFNRDQTFGVWVGPQQAWGIVVHQSGKGIELPPLVQAEILRRGGGR